MKYRFIPRRGAMRSPVAYFGALLLCCALYSNAATAGLEEALDLIANGYKDLDRNLLFGSRHGVAKLGAYNLYRVSSLAWAPPPVWVVAQKSGTPKGRKAPDKKGHQPFRVTPEDPSSWNRMASTAKIQLKTAKEISRFPIRLLAVLAPADKPVWRFSLDKYKFLSTKARKLLKKSWWYSRAADGYRIYFFSEDPLNRLTYWQLTTSATGMIRQLSWNKLE